MWKKVLCGTALGLMLGVAPAAADVTVRLLHVNNVEGVQALWNQIARDFEAANPGVTIDVQYLENEAFKAKLPTLLQSEERPNIIYSWGGGVMDAQIEAGYIEDITDAAADFKDRLAPAGVAAFTRDGRQYGVPIYLTEVVIFFNKPAFEKAGVDAAAIKTWDDFLVAVEKIKAAGETPIVVGGGEKWPMHFYWSYLVMRIGGEGVLDRARAGEDGGFTNPVFVEAGEKLQQLAELDPFNQGWLATNHAQSAGIFGDGKASIDLMGNWLLGMQAPNSASGEGLPEEDIGILAFPAVADGKGQATDTLGGLQGFLVTEGSPPEAVEFLDFFSQAKYQNVAAEQGLYIPAVKGTDAAITDPLQQEIAKGIFSSSWHQNFFDQDLGPSVGRVVNDISVAIAAGEMTPEEGAEAVQEAWDQR